MKSCLKQNSPLIIINNEKGVTAVLTAIVIAVLLGFTSLAVDVGYIYSTRNELQNVADAAALAAARELGKIYLAMPIASQQTYDVEDDRTLINAAAIDTAKENKAAGVEIEINPSDIQIGVWDWEASKHTVTSTSPDAVRVTARRDVSKNGPVTTFFAKVLSIFGGDPHDFFSADKTATAALSGPGIMAEGELKTPFAISEYWFNDPTVDYCLNKIQFSPTPSSCAGWHNFFDDPNANDMAAKMLDLIVGDTACDTPPCGQAWLDKFFPQMNPSIKPVSAVTPETSVGDSYDFSGGTDANLFTGDILPDTYNGVDQGINDEKNTKPAPFFTLFDYFRYRDGDGDNSIWTGTVPVYDDGETCDNPTGKTPIVGFAKVIVEMPIGPPDSEIEVTVDCNFTVEEGRGGGGTYGNIKGSIPNLVQ